jgi:hypothetical protein
MTQEQPSRKWQEVAAKAAREQDPQKLLELAQSLSDALDQELSKRKQP